MSDTNNRFGIYFSHLQKITFTGRVYKKFITSPILFFSARWFGGKVIEVGSGTGNGILGAWPKSVHGLEINPFAVEYCKKKNLSVDLIYADRAFPVSDNSVDACVLDNVLEHVDNPKHTLNECYRITKINGGLIIAVPGKCGFDYDEDHKVYYGLDELSQLDARWKVVSVFSIPFFLKSNFLSSRVRQYCLVAIYKKH